MRILLALTFILGLFVLGSCGGDDFQGTYNCADCLYTQLDFKKEGKVEILAGGIKAVGDFVVKEQKITITTETSEYIFVIKDAQTLEGKEDAEGLYTKAGM